MTALGTYPSGGCARIPAVYGVIMFLALTHLRAGRIAQALGGAMPVVTVFAANALFIRHTARNQHNTPDTMVKLPG